MYMFSCSFLYNCINIFYNVIYIFCLFYNGSFQKRSILSHRGRGEKIVSDNSKCIRSSEGGRGLTSYFLCGGGMDVFWNDPILCFD